MMSIAKHRTRTHFQQSLHVYIVIARLELLKGITAVRITAPTARSSSSQHASSAARQAPPLTPHLPPAVGLESVTKAASDDPMWLRSKSESYQNLTAEAALDEVILTSVIPTPRCRGGYDRAQHRSM